MMELLPNGEAGLNNDERKYKVALPDGATLKTLFDAIRTDRPKDEHGAVLIKTGLIAATPENCKTKYTFSDGCFKEEYRSNEFEPHEDILDRVIYSAIAVGGWSNMTYLVIVKNETRPDNALTHEQKVAIYDEIQHEYDMQDARNYIDDILEYDNGVISHVKMIILRSVSEEDISKIADTYREAHDCNCPDNDQWKNIVDEYINEKYESLSDDERFVEMYEKYKSVWIEEHVGEQLMNETRKAYEEREEEDRNMSFEEYVDEYGFANGFIYSCFKEFLDSDADDCIETYFEHYLLPEEK